MLFQHHQSSASNFLCVALRAHIHVKLEVRFRIFELSSFRILKFSPLDLRVGVGVSEG
jgi:hypothetical protein